ncbi:hypothetical protein TASIC1_0005008300 [Trichoderma asperellum]|uniref:Uncharacterized protein n=1 Tax=Trichoderma asperellum TaxID=101201 RepID=A0A6V8QSA6_TRIAP|nr:hypothetical protein LI328DRAFT_148207 [Trichoderma asperelloides]GFP55225.1 hypothetical protein TASIC1_0005008300 [Trichoderma asperellum]
MPPASTKANYKTYEAQARMVRAIVAAHPDVKWNYKEIVACYGSDMTEHALNHRFRRLKAQVVIVREGRSKGFDPKNICADGDLPNTIDAVDTKNIARYFGQSTTDGIQFQFRGIKKDADILRKVESEGGDVANCLNLSSGGPSVTSTPSKPTPARSVGSRTGSGTGRKRARKIDMINMIKRSSSDEEEEEVENWSDHENTPTKKPKKTGALPGQRNGTPSRRAADLANVTIAEATTLLDASDSQPEAEAPTNHTASSFAPEPMTITQPAYSRMAVGLDPGPALGGVPHSGYAGSQYPQRQMEYGEI